MRATCKPTIGGDAADDQVADAPGPQHQVKVWGLAGVWKLQSQAKVG